MQKTKVSGSCFHDDLIIQINLKLKVLFICQLEIDVCYKNLSIEVVGFYFLL